MMSLSGLKAWLLQILMSSLEMQCIKPIELLVGEDDGEIFKENNRIPQIT